MDVVKIVSSSTYETHIVEKVISPNNPDPCNFKVLFREQQYRFLIIFVQYPGCSNFEGTKILVYENVTWEQLKSQGDMDPHFSHSLCKHSPIARFVPTPKGLLYARKFCESAAA